MSPSISTINFLFDLLDKSIPGILFISLINWLVETPGILLNNVFNEMFPAVPKTVETFLDNCP